MSRLSHAEAWRRLAAHVKSAMARGEYVFLCNEIKLAWGKERAGGWQQAMLDRIAVEADKRGLVPGQSVWGTEAEDMKSRLAFCQKQVRALETVPKEKKR